MPPSPQVLIVGLDGATFDLLRPLADAGRLPTLSRLLHTGASTVLHSTVPPITPAAWTTFFTGKNPGTHGIYDFQQFDRRLNRFTSLHAAVHREKPLWQILGEAGLQSIIWDVPFTYPPRPLAGWMLTGYGTPRTPDTVITFPPDLAASLPPDLQPEIRVALPAANFDRRPAFIAEWTAIMDGRRRLLNWLIRHRPWQLFAVVFSITDNLAHVFWTYADPAHPNFLRPEAEGFRRALYGAYETCDRILGELMEAAGSAVTLVISDHGFGSVRPRQTLARRLMAGGWLAASHAPRARLMRAASHAYLRFPFLRETVKRLAPARRASLAGALQGAGILPSHDSLDYKNSRAIPAEFGLSLWLNERLAPDKDTALAELTRFLLADTDPRTGQPLIRRIHRGADVYRGEHAAACPDLVIEYANSFRFDAPPSGDNPFTEGGHTPEGILIAHGEPVAPGGGTPASLVDLAPTVLYLLSQPVPPDMDGRVLEGLFRRAYLEAHPIQRGTEPARNASPPGAAHLSAAQEAEITEQLRRLGYV